MTDSSAHDRLEPCGLYALPMPAGEAITLLALVFAPFPRAAGAGPPAPGPTCTSTSPARGVSRSSCGSARTARSWAGGRPGTRRCSSAIAATGLSVADLRPADEADWARFELLLAGLDSCPWCLAVLEGVVNMACAACGGVLLDPPPFGEAGDSGEADE